MDQDSKFYVVQVSSLNCKDIKNCIACFNNLDDAVRKINQLFQDNGYTIKNGDEESFNLEDRNMSNVIINRQDGKLNKNDIFNSTRITFCYLKEKKDGECLFLDTFDELWDKYKKQHGLVVNNIRMNDGMLPKYHF